MIPFSYFPLNIVVFQTKESHVLSISQAIEGYRASIIDMTAHVTQREGSFYTKPIIAFFSNSLNQFTDLTPGHLPDENMVFNALLLANCSTLFFIEYGFKDNSKITPLLNFKTQIATQFGQVLDIQEKNYDQVLSLKTKKFDLIPLNSQEMFKVQNTTKLHQISVLFKGIVIKEQKLLHKLEKFANMLSHNTLDHIRKKRNLMDLIFSDYSLDQVGSTANKNYKAMNSNFQTMKSVSKKLWHQQNKLAQAINSLTAQEKKVHYQTLYLEYSQIANNIFEAFMYNLNQIKKNIQPSFTIQIIFELMTKNEFCDLNQCFSDPIFSSFNETFIQVSFTKSYQTLKKGLFISCTIFPDMTTSIYSHVLGFIGSDNAIHFDDKKLSTIQKSFLSHSKIDDVRRHIESTDLIQGEIYPIYNDNSVSIQCLNVTKITISDKEFNCDPHGLQFQPLPKTVKIHGKTINFLSENHFISSVKLYANNIEKLNAFQQKTYTQPTLDKIKNFFSHTTDMKYATFISSSAAIISISLVLLCCAGCCCPSLLSSCLQFCCCCGCKAGSCIARFFTSRLQAYSNHTTTQQQEQHPLTNRSQPNQPQTNQTQQQSNQKETFWFTENDRL